MEAKEKLYEELKMIEAWEHDQESRSLWDKLTRLPFSFLDRLVPSFIHKKIGSLLDEVGYYLQSGGKYLVQQKGTLKKLERYARMPIHHLNDVKDVPLSAMDETALAIQKNHVNAATVQGATTGIGGIFTLAADIPATLALSLKMLQEIAVSYGYDPNERTERLFIIKCLQFASSDASGKESILKELSNYQDPAKKQQLISQVQGWRDVMFAYREQYGLKKLFQLVPIAGILFGALSNRSLLEDLGETGRMLYKKRRIIERLENTFS